MCWKGYKVSKIVDYLVLEDQILVSKQGVRMFLKHYYQRGTIARKEGSGMPPKLSCVVRQFIEDTMRADDETTATQLQAKLSQQGVYVLL